MIAWLQKDFVLAIHHHQIGRYGGQAGVRSEPTLDTVLAPPQRRRAARSTAPDIIDLAAHLAFGLAHLRPFRDGNLRTAQISYRLFLACNGMTVTTGNEEKYQHLQALAEGRLSQQEFADWLRTRVRVELRVNDAGAGYVLD
ncbi:type II toxin-antitoxin system death-on-curing family toxin [Pseudoxanthomonas dokdonensis]|uniref:Fido domain-containing protein n=1 Tax=Pseudoxanthomonas dokdonensis TaxID=344882 RepID=A0A0R0CUQ1_9GAMM|nr:type II toxin-antitoxin system death-on-curing family toxin [Pseudoxanthomonas dokdonensis]KRG69831.1 hypothetical protein ABB29_08560 [Pseudoxanthomonas dokdonensis]